MISSNRRSLPKTTRKTATFHAFDREVVFPRAYLFVFPACESFEDIRRLF